MCQSEFEETLTLYKLGIAIKYMKEPLVTVLMTVFNGGDYLRSSIQSVLNQTFRDFEFLIVNDCSTDDSVKIIESFNDKRIVIHNNEKNLGQTKSLNVGLKLAKGKYVARMDADDMAFPMWLDKLVKYILKHPEYVAVSSYAAVIDGLGNPQRIHKTPINFQQIIVSLFFAKVINHVGAVIKKGAIIEKGGYNEDFITSQDYELWSSLIRINYKVTNIPEVLVSIRVHKNSVGFIEESRKALLEVAEIITRTVNKMTNLIISCDEAIKLRLFYRFPSQLTINEFKWAQSTYKKIFDNLKDNFKLDPKLLKIMLKKKMLRPICMFAIHAIENNKPNIAREVINDYNRHYGYHILPGMIFLLSYFRNDMTKKMLYFYTKYAEISAKFKIKIKNSAFLKYL